MEFGRTIPTDLTSTKACAKIGFLAEGKGYAGLRFIPANLSGDPGRFIFSHGTVQDPDNQTTLVTIDQYARVGINTPPTGSAYLHVNDVLRVVPRNAPPASAEEGCIYVNGSTHHIYCYLNGVWKQLDN
jgi:hypothetical protein